MAGGVFGEDFARCQVAQSLARPTIVSPSQSPNRRRPSTIKVRGKVSGESGQEPFAEKVPDTFSPA